MRVPNEACLVLFLLWLVSVVMIAGVAADVLYPRDVEPQTLPFRQDTNTGVYHARQQICLVVRGETVCCVPYEGETENRQDENPSGGHREGE